MSSDRAEAAGERLVLGTAGHIDHGKTALIRALTGIDTDRLPEEKQRGITIELGFAPLDLAEDLRVGVVDVPGHEGLVRTMVAGATGIDLLLLVVAADEGVMPQTREHLAICELLGIRHGVVALTKIDAADSDMVDLAEEEVRELLAPTFLAAAPIVRVSSISGEGIEALRKTLVATARASAARTPRHGPPRLCVDRLFAAKGFGSVVTGTLIGGALSVGDAVEIYPTGRSARVRGLQSFGVSSERVAPGARCAVNLQGVELAELARGMVVSAPQALHPTSVLDAEIRWLPEAPAVSKPISVEFLAGTTERRARLAPIGRGRIDSGERGFARLHLEGDPVALLPGDRFILRGFARIAGLGASLGGGAVLDVAPPHRRLSHPGLLRELTQLVEGDPQTAVELRVTRAGFAGCALQALRRELGSDEKRLRDLLTRAAAAGRLQELGAEIWLGSAAMEDLERRLLKALTSFHARERLRPGMPRGALRGALPENLAAGAFEQLLERLAAAGRIAVEEKLVRLPEHEPTLSPRERAVADRVRSDAASAGLEPPTPREWAEKIGVDAEQLRGVLAHLEREGALVRAPGDLWFDRAAVDELRQRVVAHLREHESLDTPAYKTLIGTTRKYAVPLMELFDAERLTMRAGEARILRRTRDVSR
jgi:selenocysteine-specific elongation factor